MGREQRAQQLQTLDRALAEGDAQVLSDVVDQVRTRLLVDYIKKHSKQLTKATLSRAVQPLGDDERIEIFEQLSADNRTELAEQAIEDGWLPEVVTVKCLGINWRNELGIKVTEYARDFQSDPLLEFEEIYRRAMATVGSDGARMFRVLLKQRCLALDEQTVRERVIARSMGNHNAHTLALIGDVVDLKNETVVEAVCESDNRRVSNHFSNTFTFFDDLCSKFDFTDQQYQRMIQSTPSDQEGVIRGLLKHAPDSCSKELVAKYNDVDWSTQTKLDFYKKGLIGLDRLNASFEDVLDVAADDNDRGAVELIELLLDDGLALDYNKFKDLVVRSRNYPRYADLAVEHYDADDEQMARALKRALYQTASECHNAEYKPQKDDPPEHPKAPLVRMVKLGTPLYPDSTTTHSECSSIPGFMLELDWRVTSAGDDPFVAEHGIELLKQFEAAPPQEEAQYLIDKAIENERIETLGFLIQCGFKPKADRLKHLRRESSERYDQLLDVLPRRMRQSLRNIEQAQGKVQLT